jgi:hypothetical protein
MKRVKLLFSFICLLVVVGSGLAVTVLPWQAQALPTECRCRMNGLYYYEFSGNDDCQWLCD